MLPRDVLERNARIQNVVQPVSQILAKMSWYGIVLSEPVIRFKADAWRDRINRSKEELFWLLGGRRFNIDSPTQLQNVLYNQLGLLGLKKVYNDEGAITADQFALAKLHFDYGDCSTCHGSGVVGEPDKKPCGTCNGTGKSEYDRIIHLIREIRHIRHRASNFLWPFLDWEECPFCKKGAKGDCDACAGTGVGKIIGHNPRLVTIDEDGDWVTHPTWLQVPNTHRLSCVNLNFQQFARYLERFNIRVRDIVIAKRGKKLIATDKVKGEAFGCAHIFRAKSFFDILEDKEAFAYLASELFGVPVERCKKGTSYYNGAKTFFYSGAYGSHEKTMMRVLVKMAGLNLILEQVREARHVYRKRFDDYFTNVKEYAWDSLQRGWCRSVQGAIFRIPQDPVIMQFEHWTDIYHCPDRDLRSEAIVAFEKVCRSVSSFVVQDTVTGLASQLDLLKLVDTMDRMLNPNWQYNRFKNGDPNRWYPRISKHDEIISECVDDLVPAAKEIQERVMKDWNNFEPYLENHPSIKIPLEVETQIYRQWDEIPPGNWQELTKEKNPLDFWENGLHFVE